jgi:methyltransferase
MAVSVAGLTLLAMLLIMGGEAALSRFNERVLRARGAVEPRGDAAGDVLALMTWAYPASFIAMALEGALTGPAPPVVLATGLAVLGLSKALKMWAISTLGVRWTFRVLVLPDVAPVSHGPYAWMRHPNYLAVIGELAGMALIVWAPITGVLATLGYGVLLRRKIAVEDRALGRK